VNFEKKLIKNGVVLCSKVKQVFAWILLRSSRIWYIQWVHYLLQPNFFPEGLLAINLEGIIVFIL
jgi:hypothetical protein